MKNKTTESDSLYDNLEGMSTKELLSGINKEDQKVAACIEKVLPQIEKLIDEVTIRMLDGGRLFYLGAGTSGRLGIVDASECPPTFGISDELIIGLIAGGDGAIRRAVEFAEDDEDQGWKDIAKYSPKKKDTIIGIAASGITPYVIGAVKKAKANGLFTGCITCNLNSKLAHSVDCPVEVYVGPEFVTGSTRMKAGTAQKLVLNMISTSVMIKLGKVRGNKMVDMQLSNNKLLERAVRMVQDQTGLDADESRKMLDKYGSVRKVLQEFSLLFCLVITYITCNNL